MSDRSPGGSPGSAGRAPAPPAPIVPPALVPSAVPLAAPSASITAARRDQNKLCTVLCRCFNIHPKFIRGHPIHLSLVNQGVNGFDKDFVFMTDKDIDTLKHNDPRSGDLCDLNGAYKAKVRALLSHYHYKSYINKGAVNMMTVTSDEYDDYRTSMYDPNEPVIPWSRQGDKNSALTQWTRNIKPSARDFKPFREIIGWNDYRDGFIITATSQNLQHLIDPTYVVHDADLYKAQCAFLYKVMMDQFIHHEAKQIVKRHKETKDTAAIWTEMCEFYDNSIAASMMADQIMANLTGTKMDKVNWNKGQGEHITHYVKEARKFNQLAPDSYMNDAQIVRMLQNYVSNTPNLSQVLYTYKQTRRAAGKDDSISLDDYAALLSQQAQVYDNANTRSRSSLRRNASTHDSQPNEGDYETFNHDLDEDSEPEYEANVNDQKRDQKSGRYTSGRSNNKNGNQKRQANQMQGSRSRAYMDRTTWEKLSETDQKTWDTLSDQGKGAVTTYHFNKGKEVALRDANKMEAKSHDMVFDDDSDDDNSVIEAKVHESDLATKSDVDSTRKMYENEGVDFNTVLQAQTASTRLEASVHMSKDTYNDSSDDEDDEEYGIEVNVHWFKDRVYDEHDGDVIDFDALEDEEEEEQGQLDQEIAAISDQAQRMGYESDSEVHEEYNLLPLVGDTGVIDFDQIEEAPYEIEEDQEPLPIELEEDQEPLPDNPVEGSDRDQVTKEVHVEGGKNSPNSDLTDDKTHKSDSVKGPQIKEESLSEITHEEEIPEELIQDGVIRFDLLDEQGSDGQEASQQTAGDESTLGRVMTREDYNRKGVKPAPLFSAKAGNKPTGIPTGNKPTGILKKGKSGNPKSDKTNKTAVVPKTRTSPKKAASVKKGSNATNATAWSNKTVTKETLFPTGQPKGSSKNMAYPFQDVEKPSKTVERIQVGKSGFELMSQKQKDLQELKLQEKKLYEDSGVVDFDDPEAIRKLEEEMFHSVPFYDETPKTEPKVKFTPKTTIVNSEFAQSAYDAAGIEDQVVEEDKVPRKKGSKWIHKNARNKSGYLTAQDICAIASPAGLKKLGNSLGLREETPPESSENSSQSSTNRFAVLADDDDGDSSNNEEGDSATTDVVPIPDVEMVTPQGPVIVPILTGGTPVNTQDTEQGTNSALMQEDSAYQDTDLDAEKDFQGAGSN